MTRAPGCLRSVGIEGAQPDRLLEAAGIPIAHEVLGPGAEVLLADPDAFVEGHTDVQVEDGLEDRVRRAV